MTGTRRQSSKEGLRFSKVPAGSGSSLPVPLVGGDWWWVLCTGVIGPPGQGYVRTWQEAPWVSLGRAARPWVIRAKM